MTTQDIVILAVSGSIAAFVLIGALAAWRTLARVGEGLRSASDGLSERAAALPDRLFEVRTQLDAVDAQVEHALWTLGELDDRIDRASVDLRAKRVSSDSLRLRFLEGRVTIAKIRQLMRLMIRLGELRRAFL